MPSLRSLFVLSLLEVEHVGEAHVDVGDAGNGDVPG